ncbi:MAG: TauD/TfdA dioxygenase family protein [Hyphomicrobiaceae bacterium]
MQTRPLHTDFGAEVLDVDLNGVTANDGYPAIRELFEKCSLLLFRDQSLSDDDILRIGKMFGPIEDRKDTKDGKFVVPKVSNRQAHNALGKATEKQLLNLKSNQLWHTDSTFLPVPALANIITARVVSSRGGQTQLVSTRAAWKRLPDDLKTRARDAVLWHRFAHSRAKIDPELATHELFTKWPDQAWYAVLRNPVTGENALYLASHAYGVDGLEEKDGQALIETFIDHATQPENIYAHDWRVGDVLIWDERATLHRGTPWPYEEERTLASICVSLTEADGLSAMKPGTTHGVITAAS